MSVVSDASRYGEDLMLQKIAREIATDLHPLPDVLKRYGLDPSRFDDLQSSPIFQHYLRDAVQQWESALNTHDRVKVKAALMMEEWLPELYARMHDSKELLSHKIEAGKLVQKLAGMGITHASEGGGGERFSVTINLGADNQVRVQADLPSKVIDYEEDE